MTQPALSFGLRGQGRHYPYLPCDVSAWPRNQWGSVNPEDVPGDVMAYPSVTNILSVSDKPALKGWAAERALIDLYESGTIPLDLGTAIKRHKMAFDRYSKKRADAGTRAHTLAEKLAEDLPLPTSISEEDAAYADAFMAFWSDYDPTTVYTEATVYGDRYAGTGDLFASIEGRVGVIDWKTRAERDEQKLRRYGALYDETKMQLAALGLADEVAVPVGNAWKLAESPDVEFAMGVVLFPDGTYVTEEVTLPELEGRWYPGFMGARALWASLKGAAA